MEFGITVERALELIAAVPPVGTESVPAAEARGRVLAEDVLAPMDQPPWPRSPLDGYALRAADSAEASRGRPVKLRVVGTLYAGDAPTMSVGPGDCVRIMTGAPIPDGCDCVAWQEDTDLGTETVRLFASLRPWENYCRAGSDFQAGAVLAREGTLLNAAALGALASAGLLGRGKTLRVRRRLLCALYCTGDELVPQDERPLPPGKIYSSNAALLSARLRELGAETGICHPNAPDGAEALAKAMWLASGCSDLYVTTGGVSVGARDEMQRALALLGAERVFQTVRMKPGSPLMLSVYGGVPVLSLSGNPFAAAATFELFGRALLAARSGCEALRPVRCRAVLATPFPKAGKVRRFVRGVLRDGAVYLPEGHSSGQLASAVGTNCLAELPAGEAPEAGESVTVWLL